MSRVNLEIEQGIARVSLNRPDKRNALDLAMFEAIRDVQKKLRKDKSVRVIILSAHGTDFCSGLDIKSALQDGASLWRLLWKWWPGKSNLAQVVSTGWRSIPVPVIAVIQGRCWGGGLQIALGADFRFAQPDASFAIMEGKWGLIPDMGGTLAFRELSHLNTIKRLAMTAELFDAVDAQKVGLVDEIAEDAITEANTLAETLLARSPDALAACKRLYNECWNGSDGRALARESWYQIKVMLGRNQRIAVKRGLAKDATQAEFVNRGRW